MKKSPKYFEIMEWVTKKIETGELVSGTKIPSENELQSQFGVSRQTVRRAVESLEDSGKVIRRHGSGTYITNENAFVQRKRTMRIQLIITYIDEYIFPKIIKAIEETIFKEGYILQVAFTNNKIGKEQVILEHLLQEDNVDAVIVEPVKSGIPNPNITLYDQLKQERKIPILFINSYYSEIDTPYVGADDKKAGRIVTEHLLKCGHRNIAGIFKVDDGQGHRRYEGYMTALLSAGIQIKGENIVWLDTEDAKHMLEDKNRYIRGLSGCTACVCYNDQIAERILAICKDSQIRVPKELSLIGVDNSDIAGRCEIPLTSADTQVDKIGRLAGKMVIEMIEGKDVISIPVEPKIIVRGSVKGELKHN